jgi:CRP-like cAMP-binding protein
MSANAGIEEEYFVRHKKEKAVDTKSRKTIKDAMKQDRICGFLDEPEIDAIIGSMEYFEFAADSMVVRQGEDGSRFVVIEDGTVEVSVDGSVRNTLGRGTSFGGISLLYNCPRTASVKASTKVSLWGASGVTFQKVLKENAKKNFVENRKLLESIKLLQGLTSKQKDYVCEAFFTEVFEAGVRVVTQGEAAPTMHLVKSGQLSVVQDGTVKPTGELVGGREVSKLGPGDCFGERGILQKDHRGATVIATSRCVVLCVSAEDLQEALGQPVNPQKPTDYP